MRAAFLGPAGTYSHEALAADPRAADWEPLPEPTVFDAVMAVEEGRAERALVPIENSLEGAVGPTLDALAVETERVVIVGEVIHSVRHALIARSEVDPAELRVVVSHPQAMGQCARFLRTHAAVARLVPAASTAEAVRTVVAGLAGDEPAAAIGTPLAAELYGGFVIQEGVEDADGNETRFVWLAPRDSAIDGGAGAHKTSVVWWGGGDETPGWLVRCLSEFAFRGVNLTRIESRPRRLGLGHYMFFADLEGAVSDPSVAGAIEAVRTQAETVKVLGSYPAAG
jgi:prephenate dehydratase